MNKPIIALLLAGLGSSITPAIGHAAEAPQGVPVAVQRAIDEMGKACAAWPAFSARDAVPAHPVPIDLAELQGRSLCSDVTSLSNNELSGVRAIGLLIMAVAFFALIGLFVTLQHLWRGAHSLVWWIKREKFT